MAARSPQQVLRDVFGFSGFRSGQQAVIERLLAGQSAVAIFPTGGGKSICYQLPALMLDGVSLVVSPLIALMKDQVEFLQRHHVSAARLDSSMTGSQTQAVLQQLQRGELKLLYISPERLSTETFRSTLQRLPIVLLAIDESHCISEWGHNFRPDYLKIGKIARELHIPRILALTATATPGVAEDIARAFAIPHEGIIRTGFHRPNLHLACTPCRASERMNLLLDRLKRRPKEPTIIYVTARKTSEELAEFLSHHGIAAKYYHAGMESDERSAVQDWFMSRHDAVIVATIAFGMGIDKADIRAVWHYNVPKSLESYAQEIGRAGRDGQPAHCEVLAAKADRIILENFIFGDSPDPTAVTDFVHRIMNESGSFDLSIYEEANRFDIKPLVLETILTYLELANLIVATGSFYTEFKFLWQRNHIAVLARFDADRQAFLRQVFEHARRAAKWLHIDVAATAEQIGEPRQRIVTALNYLHEQGDILLQVAGDRQGFRRTDRQRDVQRVADRVNLRFREREQRDLERLNGVFDLLERSECLTRNLVGYFGEVMGPCGHCDICEHTPKEPLPSEPMPIISSTLIAELRDVLRKRNPALATPRQLARFLCGIASPQATRAKLGRHPLFGSCVHLPYPEVLRTAEELLSRTAAESK